MQASAGDTSRRSCSEHKDLQACMDEQASAGVHSHRWRCEGFGTTFLHTIRTITQVTLLTRASLPLTISKLQTSLQPQATQPYEGRDLTTTASRMFGLFRFLLRAVYASTVVLVVLFILSWIVYILVALRCLEYAMVFTCLGYGAYRCLRARWQQQVLPVGRKPKQPSRQVGSMIEGRHLSAASSSAHEVTGKSKSRSPASPVSNSLFTLESTFSASTAEITHNLSQLYRPYELEPATPTHKSAPDGRIAGNLSLSRSGSPAEPSLSQRTRRSQPIIQKRLPRLKFFSEEQQQQLSAILEQLNGAAQQHQEEVDGLAAKYDTEKTLLKAQIRGLNAKLQQSQSQNEKLGKQTPTEQSSLQRLTAGKPAATIETNIQLCRRYNGSLQPPGGCNLLALPPELRNMV